MRYDHSEVEARWQRYWEQNQTFATPTDRTRPKYFVLDMFPYPSGTGLHVGHPKGYVSTDVVGRAKRMMGFNVMRVMGWDSFGLPSERQAVKEGIHPREVTARNIDTFRQQLQMLGLGYDWSREFATSDPRHYKWTQWIFRKLYERGLAYQADVAVNWCPAMGTVLANEEVNDGVYIETGDPVEQRTMKQWMFKITAYADRLLAGLDDVDWPHSTEKKQRDWIGRSEGAQFRFEIQGSSDSFEVFTTRPDTLFGCTYAVLAPEHALVGAITSDDQRAEVQAYLERTRRMSQRDRTTQAVDAPKTGAFTGAYAICPVNGEPVPIWISDYVLASYGTGAVFACPAHDERDHAFATTFDLPIIEVVSGGDDVQAAAYTGDGPHVNSAFLDGLDADGAKTKIIAWLEERGIGEGTVNFKLRDWLFSRQRYWGEPFPIVFDENDEPHLLPESALPVELPDLSDYTPTTGADGEPLPPLARATDWVNAPEGRRETNTMPQWAGSCWYYLRYLSPERDDVPWDAEEEKYWMPVDLYVGGNEHAVLHLLYARFWHQVLFDEGLVSTPEPFMRLFHQGMIHALAYNSSSDMRGKFYYPYEVEQRGDDTVVKETGEKVFVKNMKMSKSRYNVTNPNDMCEAHGADALRLYEVFMGPLEDGGQWEDAGVAGTKRFIDRVWRLVVDSQTGERPEKLGVGEGSDDLHRALHIAIKAVTEGVDSLKFNTAVADLMVFVNEATRADSLPVGVLEDFLRILSPFAPHISEELWMRLGHTESIAHSNWPAFDEARIALSLITLAVQVNGKMRGKIEVPADVDKATALATAKADSKIAEWLAKGELKREIVVPGRLINFVVAGA